MNFKHWLLSEELKSANAPNLSLTTKAKPLDAPNPKLTTKAKPLDVNSINYKKNAQNLIALGNHFKGNDNKEPFRKSPLGKFLRDKRYAFQDSEKIKIDPNHTKTTSRKWYKTDIQFGIDAGLPEDWHLFTDKYTPERKIIENEFYQKKSNQKIIALGKYFKNRKTKGKAPYGRSKLGIFLTNKRTAFRDYEKIKKDPKYKKTITTKWYDADLQFGIDAGLPRDWHLFNGSYKPEMKVDTLFRQKNNQKLVKLGKHFQRFGEPLYKSELSNFLYNKRKAYEDFTNDTKYSKSKWYDTDEKVAEDAGLPKGWHLPVDNPNISRGEKLVGKTLKKLKLNSIRQYRDEGCDIMTGRCLRFDYSFKYKGQEYFVEYHGEQHYYPVYFGSTEDMTKKEIAKHAFNAFEVNQESDLEKYNYCKEKENKFPLLVIPYWINPDEFEKMVLSFIKYYEFNNFFAKPDIPNKNKEYHKKMYEKYLSDLKSTELVKQKTTFEQFLINKNFINI